MPSYNPVGAAMELHWELSLIDIPFSKVESEDIVVPYFIPKLGADEVNRFHNKSIVRVKAYT